MNKLSLNAIEVITPPSHCCMNILCKTCEKKEVCCVKDDYLKTITLIEQILGNPQIDRELLENDEGFTGFNFKDNSIFPQSIKVYKNNNIEEEIDGFLLSAKWASLDVVKFLYKIENYFVLFIFSWDEQFEKFTNDLGYELYYGIQYIMKNNFIEEIVNILSNWRSKRKDEENENNIEVINTTFFSASLKCDQYKKNPNTAIRGTFDNLNEDYTHILTYHCEPNKIKPYNAPAQQVIPVYPVPVPKGPCKKPPRPPRRRDDQ